VRDGHGERQREERPRIAAAVACAAAMLIALALPTLRGQLHLESDLGDFYVPVRAFYAEALRTGTDFLWYPYEFTGFYLHGEGQAALTHPLNLPSYRWLPLTLAYGFEIVRGFAFAWVGAFLFFRRHALPSSAALLGAFYFAFASFHVLHYMHVNVVAATAHLPWLLLAIDATARAETPRGRALAAPAYALLTASQLLLGHPQAVWLCAVVEGLYALLLVREGARAGALTRAAIAKALGIAAAAVQLLPTWDALQTSLRAGADGDFIAAFSLHPANFAQLLQPYLFQNRVHSLSVVEYGLYAGGFGALALAWLAAGSVAAPRRRLARGALVLAALGALLSLGTYGWLQPLLSSLPVIGNFRAASRHLFWIHVAVSAAVALVYAEIGSRRASHRERTLLIGLPLLAVAVGLLLLVAMPSAVRGQLFGWLGVASLAGMAGLALGAARGAALARTALLLFACVDLGAYDLSFLAQREPRPASLDEIRARLVLPPGTPEFRAATGSMLASLAGVRYLWGHVALWPQRQLPAFPSDLAHVGSVPARDPGWQAALRVASVAYPLSGPPLPRARLVTRAQVSSSLAEDLQAIDVARTALVEDFVALEGPGGRVSIEQETPGELLLRAHAPAQQLLVLSESWHEGWRAWVDGAPAQVLRVYGDFMGCVVPPGEHEIRLHFEPASFAQGARVSAGALAAIAAWGGVAFARSGRSRAAPPEVVAKAARGDEQVEPRP
jgi:hypothetical protein